MLRFQRRSVGRAFTLVEILIVVVILGILAAIIMPSMANASSEAQVSATLHELHKIRRAVNAYYVLNQEWPAITEEADTPADQWPGIVGSERMDYLDGPPINAWVGGANARTVRVVPGATPDVVFQTNYGWLFDPQTGNCFAGSFDGADRPLDRP